MQLRIDLSGECWLRIALRTIVVHAKIELDCHLSVNESWATCSTNSLLTKVSQFNFSI